MDLVGIMLVVDTPLAGKHDLTISAVGFDIVHSVPLGISFCVVQFILIFFLFLFTICTQCPWLVYACS